MNRIRQLPKKRLIILVAIIVALILALLFTGNLGAAVVVGVAVWLYFRYETRKSYDQEITKFEEQRRILDQRKQDFLETL